MSRFPILVDLGLLVSAAAALLLLGRPFRIPPILVYMVTGLLLGPVAGVFGATGSLALFSELGIALLLFLVGLELSLSRLRDVGGAALATGLVQVVVTALLGAALALGLGFGAGDAALLGLATTFSSTVVVVKLLERLEGVGSVHGRLAIGVLLVQDVVVALALTMLAALGGGGGAEGSPPLQTLATGLGRAAGGILVLALVAWAAVRWLLPRLLAWIASAGETLLVVSLAWCFAFILAAEAFHISIELGAFLAGIALAQLPYAHDLVRRVHPLADFFLAVFFVSLGAGMDLESMATLWPRALLLSAFVLLVKPLLVTGLLLPTRYGPRAAFLTGLTLGQVSEFGFILIALAHAGGLSRDPDLPALVGLVGLITIGTSAGLVPWGPALYRKLSPWLRGRARDPVGDAEPALAGHIVVVGMNTLGRRLVHRLAARDERVVAVDTDPGKMTGLPARGVFGDANSPAVLEQAGFARAKLVVAATQIEETNALLAYRCHRMGIPISVHAFDPSLVEELLEIGADHLMISKLDGIRLVEDELRRLGVTA